MSGRERPSLAEPPATLDGFPVWHVLAGSALYRVVRSGNGPWWFSSDGSGRFDLEAPSGTCYLADDPVVALLEALGPRFAAVEAATFADRHLWTLRLPRQCDAGDATARPARRFGVTAELATLVPYGLPQRWARAVANAGFGGLRYRSRHDPAGGRCLALFGPAGERRSWKRGRPAAVASIAAELLAPAGIVVAGPPSSHEVGPILD